MKRANTQEHDEIRIGDLFHVIGLHRWLLFTMAICGLVIGVVLSIFSYMRGEMKRTYAITSAIAVTSQNKDGLYTSKELTPNSIDISLAEDMTDSVIYVIKSDKTLDAAIHRLSLVGISVNDIYKNLTVSKYESTQIVEMTLYWRSAEEGVEILNAINAVAPSVLEEVLQIGNVSVVNNPKSQYRIGGSVNAKLWVIMAAGGILLGIVFCILEMMLKPRLINPLDITERFGMKLLGEIPEVPKAFSDKQGFFAGADLETGSGSMLDERFMSAARILEYEMRKEENHCFCVSASSEKEGSSSMAASLAFRMAEMDRRVLLVDLNVQDPMLGRLLKKQPDYYASLNGLYYGDSSRQEAIHHLSGRLDLLPAILDAKHPLFLNEDLNDLIRELSLMYDYVLLDLPAVKSSSDVMSMRSLTENVVFVARCDKAMMNDIEDSMIRLEKAGMHIVGCLANGVKAPKGKNTYLGNMQRGRKRKSEEIPYRVARSPRVENFAGGEENTTEIRPVENRVLHSAGMDQKGVIDDSLTRGFEEYRP